MKMSTSSIKKWSSKGSSNKHYEMAVPHRDTTCNKFTIASQSVCCACTYHKSSLSTSKEHTHTRVYTVHSAHTYTHTNSYWCAGRGKACHHSRQHALCRQHVLIVHVWNNPLLQRERHYSVRGTWQHTSPSQWLYTRFACARHGSILCII